jgi:diacylglycerol kinase family enzyme
LADGSIRKVGLGSVNGRYFMFHVGVGYDAAVVAQVERRDTLKRYLGHPLFAYSAVSTWFRHYEHDHPRFRVEHVDPPVEPVGSAFTIVLNTNPYTYLGNRPFDAAPEATLDRGLVVLAMRKMTVPNILRLAGRALSKGGPPVGRLRFVDCRTDVTEVTVAGDEPFPYQVDGDHLGDTERLLFRHHPEALLLVVPDSRHIART